MSIFLRTLSFEVTSKWAFNYLNHTFKGFIFEYFSRQFTLLIVHWAIFLNIIIYNYGKNVRPFFVSSFWVFF